METNFNFSEFTAFLLIHASYADLEFTDDEKELIISHVSKETFEKVHDIYNQLGDYKILETILSYKGIYYPTNDRKEELLDLIQKQFHADGEYTRLEKGLMQFLERLL